MPIRYISFLATGVLLAFAICFLASADSYSVRSLVDVLSFVSVICIALAFLDAFGILIFLKKLCKAWMSSGK